jgi:hypothetical protein
MTRLGEQMAEKGLEATRKAVDRLEERILAKQGRRALQRKVRVAKRVSRKAVKTGLVAGALTAAGVVVRDIRKRARD